MDTSLSFWILTSMQTLIDYASKLMVKVILIRRVIASFESNRSKFDLVMTKSRYLLYILLLQYRYTKCSIYRILF